MVTGNKNLNWYLYVKNYDREEEALLTTIRENPSAASK